MEKTYTVRTVDNRDIMTLCSVAAKLDRKGYELIRKRYEWFIFRDPDRDIYTIVHEGDEHYRGEEADSLDEAVNDIKVLEGEIEETIKPEIITVEEEEESRIQWRGYLAKQATGIDEVQRKQLIDIENTLRREAEEKLRGIDDYYEQMNELAVKETQQEIGILKETEILKREEILNRIGKEKEKLLREDIEKYREELKKYLVGIY